MAALRMHMLHSVDDSRSVNDSNPMQLVGPSRHAARAGNWQRAHFWSTVLNVNDSRELSPGSSSSRTPARHSSSPPIRMEQQQSSRSSPSSAARLKRKSSSGTLRCELCWSSFGQRGDLLRHVVRCSAFFRPRNSTNTHFQRLTHLGERNFHCRICGNSFGRRSVLNKHMKRHQRDISIRRSTGASSSSHDPNSTGIVALRS